MDVLADRRFAGLDLSDKRYPLNPLNGHDNDCTCDPCVAFWGTPVALFIDQFTSELAKELGDR